jgi:hypothetical protein
MKKPKKLSIKKANAKKNRENKKARRNVVSKIKHKYRKERVIHAQKLHEKEVLAKVEKLEKERKAAEAKAKKEEEAKV